MSTSRIVLQNLILNRDYATKVTPYIKAEYFQSYPEKVIFGIYRRYVANYSSVPTVDIVRSELNNEGLSADTYSECEHLVDSFTKDYQTPDIQYLMDETEKWCRFSACRNAVEKAIEVISDQRKPLTSLPDLFNDALSVNFETNLGHDYYDQLEERIEKIQTVSAGIPSNLNFIDECLGGGFTKGTMCVFVAGTGGGKSLMKSHLCAEFFKKGYNCLYCTLEMSDVRIGLRLDSNITCIPINQLQAMSPYDYKNAVMSSMSEKRGKCKLIDYPPQTISVSHLRNIMNDMETKSNFKPDFVFVDYLNHMKSSRLSDSNNNSYAILKSVSEELFGLAKEKDCCVITSTQLNRSGYGSSEASLDQVSDSMGIVFSADATFALTRDPILSENGEIRIKCLKTRFSDKTNWSGRLAIDWSRMTVSNSSDDGGVQPFTPTQITSTKPNTSALLKPTRKPKFENIKV